MVVFYGPNTPNFPMAFQDAPQSDESFRTSLNTEKRDTNARNSRDGNLICVEPLCESPHRVCWNTRDVEYMFVTSRVVRIVRCLVAALFLFQ